MFCKPIAGGHAMLDTHVQIQTLKFSKIGNSWCFWHEFGYQYSFLAWGQRLTKAHVVVVSHDGALLKWSVSSR